MVAGARMSAPRALRRGRARDLDAPPAAILLDVDHDAGTESFVVWERAYVGTSWGAWSTYSRAMLDRLETGYHAHALGGWRDEVA